MIDIVSEYAWVVPLKNKKGAAIANAVQSFIDDSKRNRNQIWVDKSIEVYNKFF